MEVRQREVVELQSQVKALGQEVKDTDEVDGRRQVVENKFQELLEPLRRRKNFLVASREVHQFNRDIEDEIVRTPPIMFGTGVCGSSGVFQSADSDPAELLSASIWRDLKGRTES